MAQRLPVPGQDDGVWGTILNDYLLASHETDGTLRADAISDAGGYLLPAGGIPKTDLAAAVQSAMDNTVNMTGDQTIGGTKTFSTAPIVPSNSFAQSTVTNLTADLAAKTALTTYGQQQLLTQRGQALQPWFSALANRHYARANVVCVGDSITEGQGATNANYRWLARLRDVLRARLPTLDLTGGGRGFLGAQSSGQVSFTWPAVHSGSLGLGTTLGPKSSFAQFNAAAQTITYSLTGDSADIMWTQIPFGGTFSWAVDGGSATNVSTNGGSVLSGRVTHISLGAAGAHTLLLSRVSGTMNMEGVIEFNGDYAKGIQVHDAGHYGWQASNWNAQLASTTGAAAAIAALSPKLIIIALGVNEQFSGVSPATFQTNIQTMISHLRAAQSSPYPSIVLCMYPPRVNQGSYSYAWADYVTAAWNVAAADTGGVGSTSLVTVLDFTLGPRMLGADSNVYGIWQSGDEVHPSNLGHSMLADVVASFITPV